MIGYILRRIVLTIPTLLVITLITWIIIQLPPGSWLDTHVARLMEQGEQIGPEEIAAIKAMYGLDKPMPLQYLDWVWGSLHGDFGVSYEWNVPVGELIWERLALTVTIAFTSMIFIWAVSFPIAIYSATHQYSIGDYTANFLGFIGLGVPSFLLALVGLWIAYRYFDVDLAGLFSDEYMEAPWSWGKVLDMLKHMWFPMLILGIGGTASLIRHTRANLLDEIRKPYVTTARSKGLTERKLLLKYPVRVALRPFVATVGYQLPRLVSAGGIVAIVLGLPTVGPLLLRSLMTQDMFLAGTFVMLLSVLTVIGQLLSDILLVFIDPRIRFAS
jgi:peptide/nickel transport system permease protein